MTLRDCHFLAKDSSYRLLLLIICLKGSRGGEIVNCIISGAHSMKLCKFCVT